METIKRHNQFLIEIRRSQKKLYFKNSREKMRYSQPTKSAPSKEDKLFARTQQDFLSLQSEDISGLRKCATNLRIQSMHYIESTEHLTNKPFVKRLCMIMKDSVEEFSFFPGEEDRDIIREIFNDLAMVLFNLMCEDDFRKTLGKFIIKEMEFIFEKLQAENFIDLKILVKILCAAIEEPALLNWVMSESMFTKRIFEQDWALEEKFLEINHQRFFNEYSQIKLIEKIAKSQDCMPINSIKLDSAFTEKYEQFLRRFLKNLNKYLDLLRTQKNNIDAKLSNDTIKTLEFWKTNLNHKIIKALWAVFKLLDNEYIYQYENVERVLIQHNINIIVMALELAGFLICKKGLIYLDEIIFQVINKNFYEPDQIIAAFLEIDLRKDLLSKISYFNLHQKIFCFTFLNQIIKFASDNLNDNLRNFQDKIPWNLVKITIQELQIFLGGSGTNKYENELCSEMIYFLTLCTIFTNDNLFNTFFKQNIKFLCELTCYTMDLRNMSLVRDCINLVYRILLKIFDQNQMNDELAQNCNILYTKILFSDEFMDGLSSEELGDTLEKIEMIISILEF